MTSQKRARYVDIAQPIKTQNARTKMGTCQSKKKYPPPDIIIELEKTLQQCMNEKDEYKEKYEASTRRYEDIKSQLEKSLRTIKTLQRQLKISEDNASSLYHRYAIESDLNKRLKLTQKTSAEYSKQNTWQDLGQYKKSKTNTSYDICERLDDFEGRLLHIELILKGAKDSCTNLSYGI